MPAASSSHQRQDLIRVYRQALVEGVPLDKIEEKVERLSSRFSVAEAREQQEIQHKNKHFRQAIPRALRVGAAILPTILLLMGIALVGSATYPILAYYVGDFSNNMTELKAPIPPEQLLDSTPLALNSTFDDEPGGFGTVLASEDTEPVMLDTALDYTNLSNWFEGGIETDGLTPAGSQGQAQSVVEYLVDIPKVNVKSAKVIVGGTDLNRSLIQYPGTALPGQPGAPVIFGHSVLRQFYSPLETNPRRYTSIFSYIMTLVPGDRIHITHENVRYTYVVQSKTEVKPTDTYILSQQYDSRQLKLVTCVPEGTYLRRGVITAQLVRE